MDLLNFNLKLFYYFSIVSWLRGQRSCDINKLIHHERNTGDFRIRSNERLLSYRISFFITGYDRDSSLFTAANFFLTSHKPLLVSQGYALHITNGEMVTDGQSSSPACFLCLCHRQLVRQNIIICWVTSSVSSQFSLQPARLKGKIGRKAASKVWSL